MSGTSKHVQLADSTDKSDDSDDDAVNSPTKAPADMPTAMPTATPTITRPEYQRDANEQPNGNANVAADGYANP
jgi:hypothetical protein